MQTGLQFRSAELSLRWQHDIDNVITIMTKENKVDHESYKTYILLLLSLTKFIYLFLLLE